MTKQLLVTGAGGFIGHHLCRYLKSEGFSVRGADLRRPKWEETTADEFLLVDLRSREDCQRAVEGVDGVFHLAADMGGIGYLSQARATVARNNSLMNINMLDAALDEGVNRLLFTSSACVYPQYLQDAPEVTPLKEDAAVPADPEAGYGWEKLYMEQLCQYYREDLGLDTRVVRLHNVYGPGEEFDGGREKAPAALCRKAAEAVDGSTIEIWGDGQQTRSFMYVADCIDGLLKVFRSDFVEPVNIGRSELVTIDQLADMIVELSGKTLEKLYCADKPQGVRGRNSDNNRIQQILGWQPPTGLREGLVPTYEWINQRVEEASKMEDETTRLQHATA